MSLLRGLCLICLLIRVDTLLSMVIFSRVDIISRVDIAPRRISLSFRVDEFPLPNPTVFQSIGNNANVVVNPNGKKRKA